MKSRSPLVFGLLTSTCLASLTLQAPAFAQDPIHVLTADMGRSNSCTTIDFTFTTGNFHATVRGNLLDLTRFGSGGTVGRPIDLLPPVCCFTPSALAGADVVILGSLSKGLQACETEALLDFVTQGGSVFYFSNTAANELGAAFGATPDTSGCSGGNATVADPTSPLVNGPFGTVLGPWSLACTGRFLDVGPQGNAVLAVNSPVCASFLVGAGRAVIFNDEEWCGDLTESGCAAGQTPEFERETLFDNAVAWLVPAPGFSYVPGPACSGGTSYCLSSPNSVGSGATISMTGTTSFTANDLELACNGAVPGGFGIFLYGIQRDQTPFGNGFLCIGAPATMIFPVVVADAAGVASHPLDFNTDGAFAPCCTFTFQYLYRDPTAGNARFNLSDGLEVTIVP